MRLSLSPLPLCVVPGPTAPQARQPADPAITRDPRIPREDRGFPAASLQRVVDRRWTTWRHEWGRVWRLVARVPQQK